MRLVDLAEAVAPGVPRRIIGTRPGEKLHEVLITVDEVRHAVEREHMFVVLPEHHWWTSDGYDDGKPLDEGWEYSSDTNEHFLSIDELRAMLP